MSHSSHAPSVLWKAPSVSAHSVEGFLPLAGIAQPVQKDHRRRMLLRRIDDQGLERRLPCKSAGESPQLVYGAWRNRAGSPNNNSKKTGQKLSSQTRSGTTSCTGDNNSSSCMEVERDLCRSLLNGPFFCTKWSPF